MNNNIDNAAYITAIFSDWLGVPGEELQREIEKLDIARAMGYLKAGNTGSSAKIIRRVLQKLLSASSPKAQKGITDILHRLRRKAIYPQRIEETFFADKRARIRQKLSQRGVELAENKGAVCITHDIDWEECYGFAKDIEALEEKYNIKATFNFLTDWHYRIDKGFLRDLIARGAEVGLHGSDHDLALAYRAKTYIRDNLQRAKERLGVEVKGFRSPGLSVSEELFSVLEELGFEYDSSLLAINPFGKATFSFFPYRYPGLYLWELPLTAQDSVFFRDMRLTDEQALDLAVSLMNKIVSLGGVFVFGAHPGILKRHISFFERFLEACIATQREKKASIVTMHQCLEHSKQKIAAA